MQRVGKVIHTQAPLPEAGPVGRIAKRVDPNIAKVLVLGEPFSGPEKARFLMFPPCTVGITVEPMDKYQIHQRLARFVHAVKAIWSVLFVEASEGAAPLRRQTGWSGRTRRGCCLEGQGLDKSILPEARRAMLRLWRAIVIVGYLHTLA